MMNQVSKSQFFLKLGIVQFEPTMDQIQSIFYTGYLMNRVGDQESCSISRRPPDNLGEWAGMYVHHTHVSKLANIYN